jgi:hypothetical protein
MGAEGDIIKEVQHLARNLLDKGKLSDIIPLHSETSFAEDVAFWVVVPFLPLVAIPRI